MFLFTRLNFRNLIIIYLYYILLSIKNVLGDKFIDINKLSVTDTYFVVLDSGLYLYDFNTLDCSLILNFNSSVYRSPDDKVILNEINYYYNSYILCLVNEYLFIFNENNNKTISYQINDFNPLNYKYYDLLPYKFEHNNLSLIFVCHNNEHSKLIFYYYNFNLKDDMNEPMEISFENFIVKNNKISCQINSYLSIIKCFYHEIIESKKYISTASFLIKDMNITYDGVSNFETNNSAKINQLKSTKSYNNKFFICFSEDKHPVCCINNYSTNEISKINCNLSYGYGHNYKVLYFNETNQFMLTSEMHLSTTLYNSIKNTVESCGLKILTKQNSIDFKIIYDNINKNFNYVNFNNFSNHMICSNISILEEEQPITTSLPKETTNFIYTTNNIYTTNLPEFIDTSHYIINTISDSFVINNTTTNINYNYNSSYSIIDKSDIIIDIITDIIIIIITNNTYKKEVTNKTKEEIINDIDNVIKDKQIGVNYEIKGEDFTIIIKPTNSTPLPNTTHVEFDECEQIIRQKYNISNSSIITFLQVEMENNDHNSLYNQIKYFVYNDQMKELDLSLCEEVETKIHYAIKNDSNLDISSISDFQQLGIDILNIKDKFFSDLCYSYSDSNNDMTIEDRIKYLYQNYSLCEEGCTYNDIDIENMNIACTCKIQGNDNESLSNMTSLVYEQPKESSFFDSNIGVVKCYHLVFSMNGKLNNIGFLIFSLLFLFYIIFIICFCRNGIKPVKDYLFQEMKKNGYLKEIKKNNNKIVIKKGSKGNNKNNTKKVIKRKGMISNPNKIKKIKKNIKVKRVNYNKIRNNNHIVLTGINLNNNKNKINKNKKTNSNLNLMKKKVSTNLKLTKKGKEDAYNPNNFGIIKINLNNIKNSFPKESNQSLHNYTLDEASKYDKRNIFRISYIYLLSKQIIFRTFLQRSPLELYPLKFILFIFMLSSNLALNALFYFNDNISKKYHYAKNLFLLAFSTNITIIIYSTLLSYFLITLLSKLSNSSNAIRNVFGEIEEKIKFNKKFKVTDKIKRNVYTKIENILHKFKVKIAFLFLIETILFLFFWYFVTAFCHVFSSTQTSWLVDSFLSILSRFMIELIFAFLFAKLYQISVASNFITLYKVVMCIYDFS